MKRLLLLLGWLLLASAQAAELRPFDRGEMARLLATHEGHPFALVLWSIDCPHCKNTLRQFSALARTNPGIDLVVVNTDNLGERKTIATMLAATGLAKADTWVFGDEAPERLRFEIDRRWGGELPRTYLFDRDHHARAFSGPVEEDALKRWLAGSATR